MNRTDTRTSLIVIAALAAVAIGWRLLNHEFGFAYNLEIVTAVSMLAVLRFGWKAGLIVPLGIMAVSDAFIGNSPILIFTWGSFVLIGLLAMSLRRFNQRPGKQVLASLGFAFVGSTAFYLITNFGVWLQGYYPPTFDGLMMSYFMAIPFYKTMLIGNSIFVPAAVAVWQASRLYVPAIQRATD